ncbi:MAG TPA: hypothetical protein VF600_08095 [Abditibacteriaceae bacterium]|jgi:cell division protein FtsB
MERRRTPDADNEDVPSPRRVSRRARSLDADVERDTFGYLSDAQRERRRRRLREQRRGWAVFTLFMAVFLILATMIQSSLADYALFQGQVEAKETQLQALRAQLHTGQRRLAGLQWDKGRTQSLVEHGYIQPGDRILLFPATREEQLQADLPQNDLAPHASLVTKQPPGASSSSSWRRAGDTLNKWWQALRGAAATPTGTAPAPDGDHTGR